MFYCPFHFHFHLHFYILTLFLKEMKIITHQHKEDDHGLLKYYQFAQQPLVGSVNPGANPPVIPTPIPGANSLPTPTLPIPLAGIALKRIRSNDRIELIASVDWGFVATATIGSAPSPSSIFSVDVEQTVLLSVTRQDGKVIYQTADTSNALLLFTSITPLTLTSPMKFITTTFKCDDFNVSVHDHRAVYTLTIQALAPAVTVTSSVVPEPVFRVLPKTFFNIFAFNFDGKVIDENPHSSQNG